MTVAEAQQRRQGSDRRLLLRQGQTNGDAFVVSRELRTMHAGDIFNREFLNATQAAIKARKTADQALADFKLPAKLANY